MEETQETQDTDDAPAPDQLRVLTSLVIEMSQLELRHIELTLELGKVTAELNRYRRKVLPDQMLEIGVDSIRLAGSGAEVRVENTISCDLSKDPLRRRDAMDYLKKSGNDELIKREVSVVFDKGSTKQADALMELLGKRQDLIGSADVSYEWTVHHSTLGKFVRTTLAQEAVLRETGAEPELPLPREAFGVFERKEASIHRKKVGGK